MRALFVASRTSQPGSKSWGPVGRLDYDGAVYRFVYTEGAKKLRAHGFYPFYGMEDLDKVYESFDLFPVFQNRLLTKSRPEYNDYLQWSDFDPSDLPDPISILGVTEGIRQTDWIELFPCPRPNEEGNYLNKFFLHGLHLMPSSAKEQVNQLQAGDELNHRLENDNPADNYAVALYDADSSERIGYVPRYLAREVRRLVGGCLTCPDDIGVKITVKRVNLNAPLQQRVLCQMEACWPEGFTPCSDADFEPIPAEMRQIQTELMSTR
jgi:hypothetical protein